MQYKIVQNDKAEYLVVTYFTDKWLPVSSVRFNTYAEVLEYYNNAMNYGG